MRISVLASLLGLSLVACAGNITGGGGDDDIPETCGNGAIDTGEDCDGGEGCTPACTFDPAEPRVLAAVDKTNVPTQLGRTESVTLTLTSAAFDGAATVIATVVDEADVPLPALTVTGPASVSLTDGQVVPTEYTVSIPSNATGAALNAKLKLDVTSTGGNHNLSTTVAIAAIYEVDYAAATGSDVAKHPIQSGTQLSTVALKRGATVAYHNVDTIQHITHGDGIFNHENENGNNNSPNIGLPNGTYMQPTLAAAPGSSGRLGCHLHGGDAGYVTFTVE